MPLRAEYLLVQNLKALIRNRNVTADALSAWCGHRGAWMSKILTGQRGLKVKELDKVADFFGVTVDQLFRPGIAAVLERRRAERRHGPADRRKGDRRGKVEP